MAVGVLAILFLNRSLFSSGYTIDGRFPNAAGISKGTEVMVAGVNVGSVTSVKVHGNAVDAQLSVNHGRAAARTSPRPPSRSRRCSASST